MDPATGFAVFNTVSDIVFGGMDARKQHKAHQKQLKQDAIDYGVRSAELAAQEKVMQSKLQTEAEQILASSVSAEEQIDTMKADYQAKVMTSAAASGTTGNSVSSQVMEAERTAAIKKQDLNDSIEKAMNGLTQSSLSLDIKTEREIGEFEMKEAPPQKTSWGSILFG